MYFDGADDGAADRHRHARPGRRRARDAEVHDQGAAFASTMMLAGFRSRWTTPASWRRGEPGRRSACAMASARSTGQAAVALQDRRQVGALRRTAS